MTFELTEDSCFPPLLLGVHVGLALVDAIIAVLAFYQVCSVSIKHFETQILLIFSPFCLFYIFRNFGMWEMNVGLHCIVLWL